MKIFDAAETTENLPFPALINRMQDLFSQGLSAPDRHHHTMPMTGEPDATLLLMPAWSDRIGCVKIVTATPGNSARGLPAIAGSVLVFDRATGVHLALLDGAVLTARRTAAASALAARHLARPDARRLLVLGAGKVARQLPEAFRAVRPIDKVMVWNRTPGSAQKMVEMLRADGWKADIAEDLSQEVPRADIISAATLATEPVLRGEWLRDGQHIDLLGAFTPAMREADDLALQRSSIYVDTRFALSEAGEIKIPLETGAISEANILGDLHTLCIGKDTRRSETEITLFKSVGNATMDLAAASLFSTG